VRSQRFSARAVCIPGSEPPHTSVYLRYLPASRSVHGGTCCCQPAAESGRVDLSAALRSWICAMVVSLMKWTANFDIGTPTGAAALSPASSTIEGAGGAGSVQVNSPHTYCSIEMEMGCFIINYKFPIFRESWLNGDTYGSDFVPTQLILALVTLVARWNPVTQQPETVSLPGLFIN